MFTLTGIMVVGLLVGSVLLGALLLHLLLAVILFPLKLGFALLKGVFAAVFFVPAFVIGTAAFIGVVALGLSLGFVALLLHVLF